MREAVEWTSEGELRYIIAHFVGAPMRDVLWGLCIEASAPDGQKLVQDNSFGCIRRFNTIIIINIIVYILHICLPSLFCYPFFCISGVNILLFVVKQSYKSWTGLGNVSLCACTVMHYCDYWDCIIKSYSILFYSMRKKWYLSNRKWTNVNQYYTEDFFIY